MTSHSRAAIRSAAIAIFAMFATAAWPADLSLVCAGAMKAPVGAWLSSRDASSPVAATYATAGAIRDRVTGGARDDAIVAPSEAIAALVSQGLVDGASVRPLGTTEVGVAVRAGAPAPDIATPAALRATLLAARSVVIVDPSKGTSGRLVRELFETLGIADAMRDRTVVRDGGYVVEAVADGTAEIGLHQISEILPVAGVVLAGPLPAPLRRPTRYDAAVLAATVHRIDAQSLVDALAAAGASGAFVRYGFTAVR